MRFSQRVVTLRKQHGLTQQGLSDTAGIHVQQIKRYESGSSLPMVDALKKLAITLNVTLDFLLFEQGEPEDDMKLRFEALAAMSTADQEVAKVVIDAMIVKSQVTQTVARANQKTGDVDKKDE
ncbi:MAG TPA: helix-turn-helix domain-containing protein [Arsenophonus sp.]